MVRQTMLLVILSTGLMAACSSQPTPDVEATVSAAMLATEQARPTSTPQPTETPPPTQTFTPEPTSTATETPTEVPPTIQVSGVTTTTLESGWVQYQMDTDGFSISLPPQWQRIEVDPDRMSENLGAVGELNPELSTFMSSETLRSLFAAGVKFYALDLDPDSLSFGTPTSMNIIKIDLGLTIPLDTYVELNMTQVEVLASEDLTITHQRVQLGNVEAEEIVYSADITNLFGQTFTHYLVQYLALDGPLAYVLTLSSPLELKENYEDAFGEIAQTFRLLE